MPKVIRFAQQPESKRLVFTAAMPVRWIDMDALAHVNHSVYFSYFEQARGMWWQNLNLTWGQMSTGPIIAGASCDYFKPLVFPADLQIKIYTDEIQRASFVLYYEVELKQSPGIIFAQGATVMVWIDYTTGKPITIPDNLRELLLTYK